MHVACTCMCTDQTGDISVGTCMFCTCGMEWVDADLPHRLNEISVFSYLASGLTT